MSIQPFGEKGFYLDEFRGHTLLVAVPDEAIGRAADADALVAAAADLLANDARLVLVWGLGGAGGRSLRGVLARLHAARRRGGPGRRADGNSPVRLRNGAPARVSTALLVRVWRALRDTSLAVVTVPPGRAGLAEFVQRLAVRLRVRKLVLVDAQGGIANDAGPMSFMDGAMLEELLRRGEAEWSGVGHRRPVLEAVRAALLGGVDSVNLCDLGGIAHELFTYEGSGTLFTLEDYCRVERLRVDDFLEVEKLLERGQREGYLRLRTAEEIGEILMGGYGATIGSGHLAGVCALATEPYRAARAGEIVGLYTITRFKGEGVGTKLLARVLEDARQLGLRYVFACTMHERAQAFFERNGFRRGTSADVPAEKWRGYDPARRRAITVYTLPLVAPRPGRARPADGRARGTRRPRRNA